MTKIHNPPFASPVIAARYVRALLDRRGVHRRHHASAISAALGLSPSQAHRRLRDASTWSLEDLHAIAARYGETLSELLSAEPLGTVPAMLCMGGQSIRCRFTLGEPIRSPRRGVLVATRVDGGWQVIPARQNLSNLAYEVHRIIIEPARAASRRVALMVGGDEEAAAIESVLSAAAFDVQRFDEAEHLSDALCIGILDAFVLDWVRSRTPDLIATIRSRDGQCPIIVLVARTDALEQEDDLLAMAMTVHRVRVAESPVRLPLLVASLRTHLGSV